MTCNNPKLDLANMNAYIKFGEILSIGSQDIERKQNYSLKDYNYDINMQKMMCNSPKQDLAKINADIKFGEILTIGSQDIERKRNFGANHGQ